MGFLRSALLYLGVLAGVAAYGIRAPWGERENLRQAELLIRRAVQRARSVAAESGRPVRLSIPTDIPLPGGLKLYFAPQWVRLDPSGSMEVDPESLEREPHEFCSICTCWMDPGWGEIGVGNGGPWALYLYLDRSSGRIGKSQYVHRGLTPADQWLARFQSLYDGLFGLP